MTAPPLMTAAEWIDRAKLLVAQIADADRMTEQDKRDVRGAQIALTAALREIRAALPSVDEVAL